MDMGRLSKCGIEVGSPTPLEATTMSDAKRMIQCDHIECGGQEQPHSFDSATGDMDCDGPCSPRRVQAWKDKQTKVTPTVCPIGETPLYVVNTDGAKVCIESGLVDCGTEHCSIHC